MSLLLCRRERVKHPFYIEVLGIHIYSSQELCYVIYHHPLLVMNDFADASLFSFIKNELGLGFLAGRMEKLIEAGGKPEEALYFFLQNVIITRKKKPRSSSRQQHRTGICRNMPMKRQWLIIFFPENSMEERCSAIKGLWKQRKIKRKRKTSGQKFTRTWVQHMSRCSSSISLTRHTILLLS